MSKCRKKKLRRASDLRSEEGEEGHCSDLQSQIQKGFKEKSGDAKKQKLPPRHLRNEHLTNKDIVKNFKNAKQDKS